MAGWVIMFFGENLETGSSLASRIIFLNPNYVPARHLSGWANLFSGNYRLAIEEFSRAMQLDPFDPVFNTLAMNNIALGHIMLGEFTEGLTIAKKALADDPTSPGGLRQIAIADVALGQIQRARQTVERLLELSPSTRISTTLFFRLARRPEDRTKYAEYMRLAGMPE
jgi:tetratricopeptide (TPR) repeat protein